MPTPSPSEVLNYFDQVKQKIDPYFRTVIFMDAVNAMEKYAELKVKEEQERILKIIEVK